jgi:hypothetical protein
LLIEILVPLSAADDGGAGGVGAGLHLLTLIDGGNVSLQKNKNTVMLQNVASRNVKVT